MRPAAGTAPPAATAQQAHLPLPPLPLAEGFYPALFTEVAQNYTVPHRPGAIDTRVAKYLVGELAAGAGAVSRLLWLGLCWATPAAMMH